MFDSKSLNWTFKFSIASNKTGGDSLAKWLILTCSKSVVSVGTLKHRVIVNTWEGERFNWFSPLFKWSSIDVYIIKLQFFNSLSMSNLNSKKKTSSSLSRPQWTPLWPLSSSFQERFSGSSSSLLQFFQGLSSLHQKQYNRTELIDLFLLPRFANSRQFKVGKWICFRKKIWKTLNFYCRWYDNGGWETIDCDDWEEHETIFSDSNSVTCHQIRELSRVENLNTGWISNAYQFAIAFPLEQHLCMPYHIVQDRR